MNKFLEKTEHFFSAVDGKTIAAIATPYGRAALGILRISGSEAFEITQNSLLVLPEIKKIPDRSASLCTIKINNFRDNVIIIKYPAPRSYTGENMVEISLHGNPVLLECVLEKLIQAGARLAKPGEFTMRAVLNGKLDLMSAESIANTISAQTKMCLSSVKRATQFSSEFEQMANNIEEIFVHLSAIIDFPEEEIPQADICLWKNLTGKTKSFLRDFYNKSRASKILSDGITISIAGETNAGKSTLFNKLVGMEKAIVSPHPGTTRDIIEATVELRGIPVRLLDTAGIREPESVVEQEGIKRAQMALSSSDIVVWLIDATKPVEQDIPPDALQVVNKCDRGILTENINKFPDAIKISALTGDGVDKLESIIIEKLGEIPSDSVIASSRIRELVKTALDSLDEFEKAIDETLFDIAHNSLKSARDNLWKILGRGESPDVLDEIFSRFCVGK